MHAGTGDGAPVGASVRHVWPLALAVGASIEGMGTAGTVERGALLGPRVAASDGGRNLHGMTGADAVPLFASCPGRGRSPVTAEGVGVRRGGEFAFVGVIFLEGSSSSRGETRRKGYIKRLKYMNYYIEV